MRTPMWARWCAVAGAALGGLNAIARGETWGALGFVWALAWMREAFRAQDGGTR